MTDSYTSPRPDLPLLTSAFDTGFDAEHALQMHLQAGASAGADAALLRVILLRRDYPDAQIVTEFVQQGERGAIMRATVTLPTGAVATGYAEPINRSSVEETERRAIGRALDILGHTVIVAAPMLADAPRAKERPSARVTDLAATMPTSPAPETRGAIRSEPEPLEDEDTSPLTSPEQISGQLQPHPQQQPPSVVDAMRRANLRRRPQGGTAEPVEEDLPPEDTFRAPPPASQRPEPGTLPPSPATTMVTEEKEPALEDYSWTAFWRVARPQGFNKVKVEGQIGRSIDGMTPIQVREALAETGITL